MKNKPGEITVMEENEEQTLCSCEVRDPAPMKINSAVFRNGNIVYRCGWLCRRCGRYVNLETIK